MTKSELENGIAVLLGGRVTEKLILKKTISGVELSAIVTSTNSRHSAGDAVGPAIAASSS